MKALVVRPKLRTEKRTVELIDIPEPLPGPEQMLVEMHSVGICGTDLEIINGNYGEAPPNSDHLVIGHESLGRVLQAPKGSGFREGDWAVGIVRHPDPVPCANCAVGEWDMCKNGLFTEHGIKALNGFCCERYVLDPAHSIKVSPRLDFRGVLVEPTSVVAKAWEHIFLIGKRTHFNPRKVLVIGAGPIGLLATLLGRQKNLDVFVYDRSQEKIKPELTQRLGANYFSDLGKLPRDFDIVLECTGVDSLVIEAIQRAGPDSIVCLTGVSSGGRKISIDEGALNRNMVLENEVVFGSVNANKRHYLQAVEALESADPNWLAGLITSKSPLENFSRALKKLPGDVKNVITGL